MTNLTEVSLSMVTGVGGLEDYKRTNKVSNQKVCVVFKRSWRLGGNPSVCNKTSLLYTSLCKSLLCQRVVEEEEEEEVEEEGGGAVHRKHVAR